MEELLIQYLQRHNLKYRKSGVKIQHQCISGSHNDSSPSAFTNTETMFSMCSSCGFVLSGQELTRYLGGNLSSLDIKLHQLDLILKEIERKQEETKEIFLPKKHKDFDFKYRGISKETYAKVGAYISQPSNYYYRRVIFPMYSYKDELIGFEAVRLKDKLFWAFDSTDSLMGWGTAEEIEAFNATKVVEAPKVLRSKDFNADRHFGFENLIIPNEPLFICEGLYSALSLIELGYNAVFNFGVGSIEEKISQLYNKGVKEIILFGDFDDRGRELNSKSYRILKNKFRVSHFKYPYQAKEKYDANDLLRDRLLEKSVKYNLENNF